MATIGVAGALLLGQVLSAHAAGGQDPIYRGPTTDQTIALTFDDGYASERCLQIADILTEYRVPATWFPNGRHVVAAPKVWRSIAERFPIANHTMNHPSLVGLSVRKVKRLLLSNEAAIEGVTGRPMEHILRPTFGAYDDHVLRAARELDYRVVLWDVTAADTSPRGTDRGVAVNALRGGAGSIILMHCGPEVTPRILPIVIARYACKGYRFATLGALLEGKPGQQARVDCPPPKLPARGRQAADTAPTTGSGGNQADPVEGLERFYEQTPVWVDCGDGISECTTIEVPVDYAEPDAEIIGIAVSRVKSNGKPRGFLVLGSGGPGGSGLESPHRFAAGPSEPLLARYDLVGFDTRGVGRSDPLHCLETADLDAYFAADRTTESGAPAAEVLALGEGCAAHAGLIAAHMTTVEAARDMDILRAVLGRKRLHYYGASGGTFLGATYAALFPDHVGRMVLDGALDPSLSTAQRTLGQASDDERGLEAYVEACVSRDDCPLGSTREDAIATVARLLDEADAQPLLTGDASRPLTQMLAFDGIVSSMDEQDSWPGLDAALGAALQGDGGPLLLLADSYDGRGPDGYTSNHREANLAVDCLDTQLAADNEVPPLEEFQARSPTFGAIVHGLAASCEGWPLQPSVAAPDYRAPGAAPIVVIGAARDPASSDEGAQALAERLESGILISRDGQDLTGYRSGNACIDDAVNAYYLEGQVPEDGLSC